MTGASTVQAVQSLVTTMPYGWRPTRMDGRLPRPLTCRWKKSRSAALVGGSTTGSRHAFTNSNTVANDTARFIASASAMSVAVAFGSRLTKPSLRPSRRTSRQPSVSPIVLAFGAITGGVSSIVKSCSDSVDGGRHPLTTASVLLVGVPLRTMPQPSSKRCVASSASTRVTPCAGVVAPRTPTAIRNSNPVVSHGGGSGTLMPMPTDTAVSKSNIHFSGAATTRRPSVSRSTIGSACAGSGASARSSGMAAPMTSGNVRPRNVPLMTKRSGRTPARAMRGSVEGTGVGGSRGRSTGGAFVSSSQLVGLVSCTIHPARYAPYAVAMPAQAPS